MSEEQGRNEHEQESQEKGADEQLLEQFEQPVEEPPKPKVRRKGAHLYLDEESEAEIERALAQMGGMELLEQQIMGDVGPKRDDRPLSGKVKGRVVAVSEEDVFVDLGDRVEGVVPRMQFETVPAVGTELELVVDHFDPDEGLYVLRVPGAAELFDWDTVQPGTVLDIKITGHNKGGLEGTVSGVRVFIPASHVDLGRVEDLAQFEGQTLRCEVLEVRRQQNSLVASRRVLLEREREAARERLLAELSEGQVRRGKVRNIREFGVFVDLGGVDGLIPVSELSWIRGTRPEDVLKVGDEVEVQVIKVDRSQGRITLSLKRLQENPWERVAARYRPGDTVTGRITRLADYGAFVEIQPGVEGLVHISELALHPVRSVADEVQVGQEVEVRILDINPEQRRISLSRRAVLEEEVRREEQQAVEEYRSGKTESTKPSKPDKKLKGGLEV